jgi:imidazole glycerol-phosphate synthase subunit HisF
MLQSRIIPSLLIRDRGLIKTRRFSEDKYIGDPINAVKIFNEKQVDELAIFDIDASIEGRGPDFEHLRSIAVASRMPLCYGGGITSAAEASAIISLGFEKVSVSSAALVRPQLIREMSDAIGRQSVVVTLDVKQGGLLSGPSLFSHNAKRKHKAKPLDFAEEAVDLGAGEIVINSIDRDGMMQGYDIDIARALRARISTPMTMLGGAGTPQHMAALIDAVGTVGAAAGSMFVFKGSYRAVLISYARPDFER